MKQLISPRTAFRGSTCMGCAKRAAGCRKGCEAAATEEICRILRRAAQRSAQQTAYDLNAVKADDITRRKRRRQRRGQNPRL